MATDLRYRQVFAVAAVAGVSAYAGWPLRGMAERAVRKRARRSAQRRRRLCVS